METPRGTERTNLVKLQHRHREGLRNNGKQNRTQILHHKEKDENWRSR